MLFIKNINIGRFGNKLLYYNNLVQVAYSNGLAYSCPTFENDYLFNFSRLNKRNDPYININKTVSKTDLLKKIKLKPTENTELTACLGDLFFIYDDLSTHDIFEFRSEYIPEKKEEINVAVHFRGTDFKQWDPLAVLNVDYYIQAIEFLFEKNTNLIFKIFTDDMNLESFTNFLKYMDEKKILYYLGNINNMNKDFIEMSYSDIIISSPSTFAVAAGFCGKSNKKIIHSKKWVAYRCSKNDLFWQGFESGGNRNYKGYKLI